jgi:hypothetical protein
VLHRNLEVAAQMSQFERMRIRDEWGGPVRRQSRQRSHHRRISVTGEPVTDPGPGGSNDDASFFLPHVSSSFCSPDLLSEALRDLCSVKSLRHELSA